MALIDMWQTKVAIGLMIVGYILWKIENWRINR